MPGLNIRPAIVFRAEFHKLPHAARTPMAISRVVRAAYRGVGIRFLNSVIVQLPRFIKCIMVICDTCLRIHLRSAFIDRQINDCLININFAKLIFGSLGSSMILFPLFFPFNYGRYNYFLQIFSVLGVIRPRTKDGIIIAAIHLNHLPARFKKRFRNI